jgi:hypothetical protein
MFLQDRLIDKTILYQHTKDQDIPVGWTSNSDLSVKMQCSFDFFPLRNTVVVAEAADVLISVLTHIIWCS